MKNPSPGLQHAAKRTRPDLAAALKILSPLKQENVELRVRFRRPGIAGFKEYGFRVDGFRAHLAEG